MYLIVGLESGTRLFNWNVGVDYNTGLEDRPQKYICLPYMYMPETDSSSARKCEGKCTELRKFHRKLCHILCLCGIKISRKPRFLSSEMS